MQYNSNEKFSLLSEDKSEDIFSNQFLRGKDTFKCLKKIKYSLEYYMLHNFGE